LDGLHVVANLYRCRGEARYLTDAEPLRRFSIDRIEEVGLTALGELFHEFPGSDGAPTGGGVTGCVVLAESHLAIHTWPELNSVTLDVYVCNYTQDNNAKARQVVDRFIALFAPEDVVRHDVPRDRQFMYEWLNEDYGFFLRSSKRIEVARTRFQELEIHETPQFGRLFRLDGCFMTSEKDEFYYHENLVHPSMVAHPEPRRVLIVGGGDGGCAEEVLKHPSVEQATLVELDAEVVEIARQHLHAVHRGALDSPRLQVVIGDGLEFVANTRERFDFIALDLPDPIGPAAPLYERPFFQDCKRALAPGGALALHMGSPVAQPQRVRAMYRRVAEVFPVVRPYVMFIPLYGSLWSMAVCSDRLDPLAVSAEEVERRIVKRRLKHLQYYNGDTHRAVFALPNYVRALMAESNSVTPLPRKRAAG